MQPTADLVRARAALEEAVSRHERELASFAFRLTGGEETAKDCLQDAFLRAVGAIAEGARPENLRPWLYRLVYHAAVDRLRRASIEERALGRLAAREALSEAPSGNLERLVGGLPSPYREIVFLRYAGDFSYAEMESILGIPAGTLRVYAARALERIHAKLKEDRHGL
jgi:RNA polymerase sigma-70 factor (ECF subfamily)